MKIHYLNTDLELRSNHDLSPIIQAFGEDLFMLHHGIVDEANFASFEVHCSDGGCPKTPEAAISRFCDVAEVLPREAKAVWDECNSRVVDIGIEGCDKAKENYYTALELATIKRLAELRVTVAITVYPRLKANLEN